MYYQTITTLVRCRHHEPPIISYNDHPFYPLSAGYESIRDEYLQDRGQPSLECREKESLIPFSYTVGELLPSNPGFRVHVTKRKKPRDGTESTESTEVSFTSNGFRTTTFIRSSVGTEWRVRIRRKSLFDSERFPDRPRSAVVPSSTTEYSSDSAGEPPPSPAQSVHEERGYKTRLRFAPDIEIQRFEKDEAVNAVRRSQIGMSTR